MCTHWTDASGICYHLNMAWTLIGIAAMVLILGPIMDDGRNIGSVLNILGALAFALIACVGCLVVIALYSGLMGGVVYSIASLPELIRQQFGASGYSAFVRVSAIFVVAFYGWLFLRGRRKKASTL